MDRETLDIETTLTTYYITFEQQGNTEICIKVKALDEEEAYQKAYKTYIELDTTTSCSTKLPTDLEPGQLIDEDGEEVDIDGEIE